MASVEAVIVFSELVLSLYNEQAKEADRYERPTAASNQASNMVPTGRQPAAHTISSEIGIMGIMLARQVLTFSFGFK